MGLGPRLGGERLPFLLWCLCSQPCLYASLSSKGRIVDGFVDARADKKERTGQGGGGEGKEKQRRAQASMNCRVSGEV